MVDRHCPVFGDGACVSGSPNVVALRTTCQEFDLSNEDYGKLVAAFRWAYAFVHITRQDIADRFSLRDLRVSCGFMVVRGRRGGVCLQWSPAPVDEGGPGRRRSVQLSLARRESPPTCINLKIAR